MPWSPDFTHSRPDPRLDPFRGRAGVLAHDGVERGHVLVETDVSADQLGGILWWRRWADPTEFAIVSTKLDDGSFDSDDWVRGDRIGEVAATWSDGYDVVQGVRYDITWLDEAESDRVHREVFGHHH